MMVTDTYEQRLDDLDIAVFDLETTGLSPQRDHILQIALVQIKHGALTGSEHEWKINPGNHINIPPVIISLTGLKETELRASPFLEEVFPQFDDAVGHSIVAGHNVKRFDLPFLQSAERKLTRPKKRNFIDTCLLARRLRPGQVNYKLATCAETYNLKYDPYSLHDALVDTRLCALLLLHQLEDLRQRHIFTFQELVEFLS